MFVSHSASVALYEWYTYYGRKVSFNNHNSNYDLAIEPREKFGIRKVGSKFKVMESTNTKLLFTLSPLEVKKLVSKSKGFAGRVNGVKGLKGRGGMDSKKPSSKPDKPRSTTSPRIKVDGHAEPSLYPHVPDVPKVADLKRLFTKLNKLYFNDELKDSTILKLSNSTRVKGTAKTSFNGKVITQQTILMAKTSLFNRKLVVDVMLHEMVHLHHAIKYVELGMTEYNENNIRDGHGPKFVAAVRKLNEKGFNVAEYIADEPTADSDVNIYSMMFYNKNTYLGVYSDKSFAVNVSTLKDEIIARYGPAYFNSYKYGTTRNQNSMMLSKLTSKGLLSKSTKLVEYVFSKRSASILESLNGQEVDLRASSVMAGVSEGIIKAVRNNSHARILNFKTFASYVMKSSYVDSYTINYMDPHLMSEADLKYVRDYWQDVSDKEYHTEPSIVTSVWIPLSRLSDLRDFHGQRTAISALLNNLYTSMLDGRRTAQEFKKFMELGLAKQHLASPSDIHEFVTTQIKAAGIL